MISQLIYTLLIVFGLCGNTFGDSNYQCIWYGEYSLDEYTIRNLYYNGPGKQLYNDTAIEIMLRRCGDIYKSGML